MTTNFCEDSEFEGVPIVLDDMCYTRCIFRHCKIYYNGGEFNIVGCDFDRCSFHLDHAARRTVEFLQGLRHIPGGEKMLDNMFPRPDRERGSPH